MVIMISTDLFFGFDEVAKRTFQEIIQKKK